MKITYRPLTVKDMDLRTRWLNNPAVGNNLGWQIRKGTTLKEQLDWFPSYDKNENDNRFVIEAEGKPVGIVGLTDGSPIDKHAMLYVLIGEDDFRGKGIGRRACEYIIDYGFKRMNLHKIFLEVNAYNQTGRHLYESLGFIQEGIFKDQIFFDGKYHDEIYMGLINPKD